MQVPEFLLRAGYTQKSATEVPIRPFRVESGTTVATLSTEFLIDLVWPQGTLLMLNNIATRVMGATQYPRTVGWRINSAAAQYAAYIDGDEFTLGYAGLPAVEQMRGWQGEVILLPSKDNDYKLRTTVAWGAAAAGNELVTSALGWVIPAPVWLQAALG